MIIGRTLGPALAGVCALVLTVTLPAAAEEKPAATKDCAIKVLSQNDKVQVQDVVCAPGEGSPMTARPMRVVHIIAAGKIKRTYNDGTTEEPSLNAGDTVILDIQKPYAFVNVGKTTFHSVSVTVK